MSDQYIEQPELLDEATKNKVRALKTLIEEVEATMFYEQRMATTADESLKDIMRHNRDEEIEHCCMTLEWLRRNMDTWDGQLKTYLFTEAPITEVEEIAMSGEGGETSAEGLNIGNLK